MPTQAQRDANMRLQAKKDRVSLWLDKDGTKDRIKAAADSKGLSVNAYLLDLIDKDLQDVEE